MSGATLKQLLAEDEIIIAPGIYDHMSLLIAQGCGFKALYASGYWGAASALGEPDVGIAGLTDFSTIFGRFARKSRLPIIADADTGFGSLTNLARTVSAYAGAGIAGIQLEDQPFPKICGHVGRAISVPPQEMVKRVEVAVEAKGADDIQIIARTDARRSEGLDSAIDRLAAYAEAGADVLFLEAPTSAEEIAKAASALPKPLMINAAHGGNTPILSPSAFSELGAKIVIYPAGGPLSAAAAAKTFYTALASNDPNAEQAGFFDFQEMSRLLGMDDVVAFQDRHGAP
jgi:2-methylisocitrate lyase-like PEP mutase family enzyme